MKKEKAVKYLIGIDEVGRGPLAGPVAVGVVVMDFKVAGKILKKFSPPQTPKLTDSKKLSEKSRIEIFNFAKNVPGIFYEVSYCSANQIDKIGIQKCIFKCVENCLKSLGKKGINASNSIVRLDGALRAPSTYNQTTIIRGDSSEPIISLASVIAKVTRDSYMQKLHKKFPAYNFAQSKGYGTKSHIKSIKKNGLSTEHRKSFCAKIKNFK